RICFVGQQSGDGLYPHGPNAGNLDNYYETLSITAEKDEGKINSSSENSTTLPDFLPKLKIELNPEINSLQPPPYTFITPAAGSTWNVPGTMNITWTPTSNDNVNLKLIDYSLYPPSGQVVFTIASNIPNSGSYNWTIPTTLPNKCTYGVYIENVPYPPTTWAYGPHNICITTTPTPPESCFCTDFNDQDISGWAGVHAAITASNTGSINGANDYYLRGSDQPGGSTLWAMKSEYLGDWSALIADGCCEFCYDTRIFNDGIDPCSQYYQCPFQWYPCALGHLEIKPWIIIRAAGINLSATFRTNFSISEDGGVNPGWHHICAPIDYCQSGSLPSNAMGYWEMDNSGTCNDWDLLIQNITSIQLPEEYSCVPAEIVGYDNFCTVYCDTTPGCDNCCDSFNIAIQSSVVQMGQNWFVQANLSADPNPIIEIKAAMVNFYMNKQPGCERCVSKNLFFGSMVPTGNPGPYQTSQINWDPPSGSSWIDPVMTHYNGGWNYNTNPREFIWNNMNNRQYISRPPLDNEEVYFRVIFPKVSQNQCCVDTINFCIRWTFTDTTCLTCDTLICYTITQNWDGSPGGGVPPGGKVILMEKETERNDTIPKEIIKPKDIRIKKQNR
ncbi:MAG: hypothetical protein HQ541_21565, partial [Mariniphaga sp.]|nr:hypothetical protein [Mariniphaga sp.]